MSYILEALQRAERERSRGRAPGLHDPIPPAAGDGALRRRLHWPMAAGAALLVLIAAAAGLAYVWRPHPQPALVQAGAVADATARHPPAPRRAAAASMAPSPAVPSPAVPSPAAQSPAAQSPAGRARGLPGVAVASQPAPVRPPRRVATPSTRAAAAQSSAAPAAASGSNPARAPLPSAPLPLPLPLADLTAAQRADMPPMAIGGAIYSDVAASRFLLVNGQVVREGERAAPGVTLERIGPNAAVLRWRELRIEVPY